METLLLNTPLFEGFTPGELACVLQELAPTLHSYAKGETLLAAGSPSHSMGILLHGHIEAVKYTRAGAQFTVMQTGPGGVFGDVLSGSRTNSPVTVRALEPCRVMLLPVEGFFTPPGGQHVLWGRLLANLVRVISDKYFVLDARVDLLLVRGLRRRLAAYLLDTAGPAGTAPFSIPYTRAQLANYLGFERSALSRELSCMAKEGLIEVEGRRFRIPDPVVLKALF